MHVHKRTFKFKIIIPTVAVIVVLVVVTSIFQSTRFSSLGNSLINEKLLAITNSLQIYLDESKANSMVASVSMSLDPDALKAVRAQNRNDLIRIFNSRLELYRVSYFTITDANGRVLARTHEPDCFGDSVADQHNVQGALAGKVSSFYESGPNEKVSIITGSPIYDSDDTLIGIVSAGVRFDLSSELDKLKDLFGSEVTVFAGDTRIATTITKDGQSIVGTKIDPSIAAIVIENKQEYFGDAEILGVEYKTYYKPLLNAEDEAFATIFLGIPLTEFKEETNLSIRDGLFLGLGGLIISVILLYIIISSISQPITKLSSEMHHIANGNLNIEVNMKNNDEVGDLGKSLMQVAATLHKLLEDIDKMIAEQKRGNVEYCLDPKEFLGDYKTLADNILELAAFGMIDQLTGIPNRRSFDNRMDLEWERSMRGQQPISLLMMDIDKFKTYNDTFGHQQGDVTLHSVASTIKQSLNRSIDFAARWGGEEFIVLLPDTDAQGAFSVAERIREAIETMVIPCEDERGKKATISIGVSTLAPSQDDQIVDFVNAADGALYKAKETGRNKVVSA